MKIKLKKVKSKNIIKSKIGDYILPSFLDFTNPSYLIMDNIYYTGLMIVNYNREQEVGWITPLFNLDFNVDISMFYEKLNSQKVIRELTYYIGDINSMIKTVSTNQEDIDVAKKSFEDAKYIRNKMQVEKESLYNLCIYISVFAKNLEELKFNTERIEGICATIGLQTRRAIFRQEQILNTMFPICENSNDLKKSAVRNVLTEGLTSTYPFISSELYDDEGILIGENVQNSSLILIDRFNSNKYKNPNMCVLGTSGAGKSFFVKLMILRNRYLGINQFIIDPDSEYKKLSDSLDGTYIKFGSGEEKYINIMDIKESDFSDDEESIGYLLDKISKLKVFFSLILKDVNEEEVILLEDKIIECYSNFGITFDDKSLYKEYKNKLQIKKVFKTSDDMPILEDLYEVLKRDDKTERLAVRLKPYVSGSFSYFNHHTNVDLNNLLIVADISKLNEEIMAASMYLIIDAFWNRIKKNRGEKKIIYMDEIWRLIGSSGKNETAEFIYKIFKTIRKYGGAATAITQDVSDFFSLENGKYGKAVLNNSSLKFILQLEEEDIHMLESILQLSSEEILKIKTFERGDGLLFAEKNRVVAKIEANRHEYNVITTDRSDLNKS